MPLTDVQVRNAKSDGRRVRLYDTGGMYLELSPAGGKLWRLKYRFDGKEKLLSLGAYPAVPLAGRWIDPDKRLAKDSTGYLKGARDRRDDARELLAAGIDPSAQRKAEKAAKAAETVTTLEQVARRWLEHRTTAWKGKTATMIGASLANDVYPVLGDRPVASIAPRDIRDLVKGIEARGAGETAGRVFQRLRAIYRYAIAHDLVETDPTYSLKPAEIFKPRKVKHRASIAERDVGAFTEKLDAYDGDGMTQAALRLLLLTAVRPGELRGALWSEVDLEAKLWRIGAERMKMKTEHLVPLSRQAVELLAALRSDDVFVFPSPFYPSKPLSEGTLNSALARMGYKGLATAHGFRTLFSTAANEAGWRGDLIEKQLAHEPRDEVRGAYNRAAYLAERIELMQWWADRVDQLRKGAEVIEFKNRAAR